MFLRFRNTRTRESQRLHASADAVQHETSCAPSLGSVVCGSVAAVLAVVSIAGQSSQTAHLTAARDLVARVDLDRTRYEHGQGTVDFGATPSSYTDCSGLIDHLLMHSYGYSVDDFRRWFGSRRPSARRYYDAIVGQSGFVHLERVTDLRPGDLISVKYLKESENTGHIMLVNQRPERAPAPSDASRARSAHGESFLISVIDSSESGHGPTDTRHKRGPGGRDHDGIGQGVLRVYVDGADRVTGFAWSALASSAFRGPDEEPVVLARLLAGYKP